MNIHDKSKKEWYDAFCAMAKENALLAANKDQKGNLKATCKDQMETIDRLRNTVACLQHTETQLRFALSEFMREYHND